MSRELENGMADLSKVKTPSEWHAVRRAIETAVMDALGPMPKERVELQVKIIDEFQGPNYVRRRVNYFVDEWARVSAWVFVPEGCEDVPGIVCCHSMVPQGKDEAAGLEGDPRLAFARHYAERGYATIAPDAITAGERVSVGQAPLDTRGFYKDYPKMSAMGKMLVDHMHAVDVLCDTKRVDAERLGVVGHGLGGRNALFLAAFDERVQCCVCSAGFTRFEDDPRPERWAEAEDFVHFPRLKDSLTKRAFTFDWEHVLGLAAPSPMLVVTALNDDQMPNPKSCEKAAKAVKKVYKFLGAAEAIDTFSHRGGHTVPEEARDKADEWFERWL